MTQVTAENAPTPRRTPIKQLGAVQALVVGGAALPTPLIGAAVAMVLFALSCGAIVFAAGVARCGAG